MRVSVTTMVADILEDQLVVSRALPRSLRALLLQPGRLTLEYLEGRRVRYIAPFRLYLAASVVFFLLFTGLGLRGGEEGRANPPAQAAVGAPGAGTVDSAGAGGVDSPAAAAVDPAAAEAVDSPAAAAVDPAAAEAVDPAAAAPVPARGEIQSWARNMEINVGSEATSRRVRQRTLDRFGHLPFPQATRAFLAEYVRYLPQTVFLMLPFFAGILKLLYVRRGRFYAEHFVFSLHLHAFAFAAGTILMPLGWVWGGRVFLVAMAVYAWVALRSVYGQNVLWTSLKGLVLSGAYAVVLMMGMTATMVWTFLRL